MRQWKQWGARLALLISTLTLVGMVWAAINTFETKVDHCRDMGREREYLQEYIRRTANEAADATIEKWIDRGRRR